MGGELAAAHVDVEVRQPRQMRRGDAHHVGAVGRERAPAHRAGDDARQIEHAHARERPLRVAGEPCDGRLADLLDLDQRQRRHRLALRMRGPLGGRSQHGRDQPGPGGGRLERLRLPLEEGGLHRLAFVGAAQQLQHAVAVMREVGVQPHAAVVAGAVDAGDPVPGRSRRLAVEARVALAAELDGGLAHVDADALRPAGALAPDLGRGQTGGGDGGLRRGADPEGRGQGRVGAAERDAGERRRIAAGGKPEVLQRLLGRGRLGSVASLLRGRIGGSIGGHGPQHTSWTTGSGGPYGVGSAPGLRRG